MRILTPELAAVAGIGAAGVLAHSAILETIHQPTATPVDMVPVIGPMVEAHPVASIIYGAAAVVGSFALIVSSLRNRTA